MTDSSDDRSALAVAMQWTSHVMTASLMMVIPGLVGYWLDQWLGTKFVLLVLGVIAGLGAGMWHLIRLTQPSGPGKGRQPPPADENSDENSDKNSHKNGEP